MVFETSTRFPCGDLKTGNTPRPPTNIPNTVPQLYVPVQTTPTIIFTVEDSSIPPRPGNPTGPGVPGVGTPAGSPPATTGGGGGVGPTGGPITPGSLGGAGPGGGATTGGGPSTTGPTGPSTPGPGGPSGRPRTRGAITGNLSDRRWKCAERSSYCDGANGSVAYATTRSCVECSPPVANSRGTLSQWAEGCVYATPNQCATYCISTSETPSPCITSTGPTTPRTITTPRVSNSSQELRNSVISPNSTTNAATNSTIIQNGLDIKNVRRVNVNNQRFKGYSSASNLKDSGAGMYDPYYNFFKTKPSEVTTLASNDLYLNIFKEVIAYEVSYLLRRTNTNSPWDEKVIHNLTNSKIAVSLREDLLSHINNIHTIAGKKINSSVFIEVIKKHLLEGTLNEFDPQYYKYIYENQINDDLYEFDETGENRNTIDAALAIFESLSINPDYTKETSKDINNDYKRMRFLLDDIDAEIPVLQLEGYEYGLPLNTVGVPIIMNDPPAFINPASGVNLEIGDGAGYYFSTLSYDNVEYPLMTNNSLSDAHYLSPNDNYSILKMFERSGMITLRCNSLSTINEFNSNYNFSSDVQPMYFALSAATVGDVPNPNSVVNNVSAFYYRITDEKAIQHSRNHSYNVVKINIDHRDQILHYARDTSCIYVQKDDFDLRAYDINRSIARFKIMTRTIPHGIILTPGCGSLHNPFNGRSVITDFTGSAITRSLDLNTSILMNDTHVDKPFLDTSKVFATFNTDHYGLYEKYFNQDIEGEILTYNPSNIYFQNSYFYDGQYTSVQPPSSTRTQSPESRLINIANKLTSIESVEELSWWDIHRRLKINDVGSLMYTNIKPIIRELSLGFSNQKPIKTVLSRPVVTSTGIPDDTIIPNDEIIINVEDRYTRAKDN